MGSKLGSPGFDKFAFRLSETCLGGVLRVRLMLSRCLLLLVRATSLTLQASGALGPKLGPKGPCRGLLGPTLGSKLGSHGFDKCTCAVESTKRSFCLFEGHLEPKALPAASKRHGKQLEMFPHAKYCVLLKRNHNTWSPTCPWRGLHELIGVRR